MVPISDATKRTWALQLIRSAAQWVGGYVASLGVVALAVSALGVDPDTIEGAVRTVVEVAVFLAYIAGVRALERYVHPSFGWLNGWRADLDYRTTADVAGAVEITGRRVD